MRTTEPTRKQFNAYLKAFAYFNRELFDGMLPPCFLNFSRHRKGTLGFFAPERWSSQDGGENCHEISLNPDLLKRPVVEIMGTLVHEMVHLWQEVHGKPSRRTYHNHEWAAKMEAIGLMPSDTGKPGGKRIGQRMTHYVIEGGPFGRAFKAMPHDALFPWVSGRAEAAGGPGRLRGDKVPYQCPACKAKVWGKAGLLLRCVVCEALFQESD